MDNVYLNILSGDVYPINRLAYKGIFLKYYILFPLLIKVLMK
jgi:hypothetical protein